MSYRPFEWLRPAFWLGVYFLTCRTKSFNKKLSLHQNKGFKTTRYQAITNRVQIINIKNVCFSHKFLKRARRIMKEGEGIDQFNYYAERETLSCNYVGKSTFLVLICPLKKENTSFHICLIGENYLKVLYRLLRRKILKSIVFLFWMEERIIKEQVLSDIVNFTILQ